MTASSSISPVAARPLSDSSGTSKGNTIWAEDSTLCGSSVTCGDDGPVATSRGAADGAASSCSVALSGGARPGAPGYHAEREHYLAQPLIGGGGQDIRAYVVAGTCVALMRRVARPGEIRANLAQGATGSPLPADHPAGKVAAAALRACGLDFGGVDMIEDAGGTFRVLEVDAWAGFAGITQVTGADVAGAILDHAAAEGAAR